VTIRRIDSDPRPAVSGFRALIFCRAVICAAALLLSHAFAQDGNELSRLINAYRGSPQICEGKETGAVQPLAVNPVLARVQGLPGAPLQKILKEAGYAAARSESIMVSGPPEAAAAMAFLKKTYCRSLLSPEYAEIGVSHDGDTWRIVLAQPLLSINLGDWRTVGKDVLRLVNVARAEPRSCGSRRFGAAPPVAWNEKLAAAAFVHSQDMANRNYFNHAEAGGSLVADRARQQGYSWRRIGENIAAGQGSVQQVVAGWLSSPGHCANLMTREFADMGAAYALNSKSEATIYWTQVFGTQR
jgi:hypothetical protein